MSELNKSTKSSNNTNNREDAPRGDYKRKDTERIEKEVSENFVYNIALIRAAILALYQETPSLNVNDIYRYLGTNTKELTSLITSRTLSKKRIPEITEKLTAIGFYKNHLIDSRTCKIIVPDEIRELVEDVIDETKESTVRKFAEQDLQESLRLLFIQKDSSVASLLGNCYRLMYYATNNDEWNFYTASATLEKLLQVDLGNISKTNSHYIEFIKNLSKSCSHFGITQTTPIRNIMTETSAMLSILCQSDITADDVASQECAQLLHQMAQTMLIINDSINSKIS